MKGRLNLDYKYSCVVDVDNLYKTFVLVYLEPGENGEVRETISGYELAEGERLLEVSPPSNLVKPRWNGSVWEEGATPEEIAEWESQNPPLDLPDAGPTQDQRIAALEQQVTDAQMAIAESYETADTQATTIMLAQAEAYEEADRQKTDILMALAEVYEILLTLQERVAALEGGVQENE